MKITVIGHILFSKLFSQYWNNKDKKNSLLYGSNCRVGKWQENNNLKNVYPIGNVVLAWHARHRNDWNKRMIIILEKWLSFAEATCNHV